MTGPGRGLSPGDVIGYEPDGTPLILAAAFCPRCGDRTVATMDAHLDPDDDWEWSCKPSL